MKGIITKTLGGYFFVADKEQNIIMANIRGKIKKKIYPGDYVEYNNKIVEETYKRNNLLPRPHVANVDKVLITHSLHEPDLNLLLLDRFIIAIEASGLNPVIIINKMDKKLKGDNILINKIYDYTRAGYNVFFISAKDGQGINELKNYLKDDIMVLTGPSGVGKTSLINRLCDDLNLPTNKVSSKLKKGIHTTRHVELLPLYNNNWLADTPGFTSLNIKNILVDDLKYFFPEFNVFQNKCKFNTCSHTHEPDCAIKKAVNQDLISKRRYNSYLNFYKELKNRKCNYD